ncbi:hypothetical protein PPL_10938 [Heterostelium album PN500]|uniref:Uncharacterized protein n=1 Tax=Heterostelium pallidum (strain ATCC 26659 / Pp 5 / PN500) TaxID=670386 RepID=D3BSH0_HETP5|nr:hypothetical protein PPL_10938 [Heterostelium album PN500]EFA75676.1 hypothetical protein PPL_10938 [Heterostelium album PN500]|eukprot:XP_020427810.1 hypothetical protein PPL_10938 [Heterostelium album PN500]
MIGEVMQSIHDFVEQSDFNQPIEAGVLPEGLEKLILAYAPGTAVPTSI